MWLFSCCFGSFPQDIVLDRWTRTTALLWRRNTTIMPDTAYLWRTARFSFTASFTWQLPALEVYMFWGPNICIICHCVWPLVFFVKKKKHARGFPMASKVRLTINNVEKRDGRSTELSSLETKTMHFTEHSWNSRKAACSPLSCICISIKGLERKR